MGYRSTNFAIAFYRFGGCSLRPSRCLWFGLWLRCRHVVRLVHIGNNVGNGRRWHGCSLVRHHNTTVILVFIVHKRPIDARGDVLHSRLIVEQPLFVGRGDKAQFDETTGHRRFSEHEEPRLMHALVGTIGRRTGFALHHLSQVYAVGHVAILHKLEHDIALRRVGIKALIALFIVFFYQDNGVLALCNVQIVASAVHS